MKHLKEIIIKSLSLDVVLYMWEYNKIVLQQVSTIR